MGGHKWSTLGGRRGSDPVCRDGALGENWSSPVETSTEGYALDSNVGRLVTKDLSVNNINWQLDLAQGDDDCGEVVERQEGVLELLVAHPQLPEPVDRSVDLACGDLALCSVRLLARSN